MTLEHLSESREAIGVGTASHDLPVDGFTASGWKQAEDYVNALKPLAEATTTAGGDRCPSLSLKIPMLYCTFEWAAEEDNY